MNCPTCKRTDEFVFEKVSRLWRCDRCHERFRIIPTNDGSDRAEEFERAFPTNADRIRGMSDEELAEILSQIAYARYTPWAEPFSRTFCDDCPVTTVKLEGYYHEMDLHECDFTDGKCPYGSDIVYWLQQPAKEEP